MTVDGFEPPLLEDIVETHARTALRQLRLRLSLTIEAIIATAHGDNPKIVRPKLAPIYTVDPNTTYRDVEGTVELARQRLERTPASTMSLDELTELFTDVAWISWRANALRGDGFRVLEEVATAVDDEFIAWGLRLLAEHRRWQRRTDDKYRVVINRIMDDMETGMARRLDEAKRRYQLVSAGIVAIADGRGARIDEVLDEVTSG